MEFKRRFLTSVSINTVTACFNMLATVFVVRFFGAEVYANFIVDLAYISLIAIFFEIVPTNYILFRVQDDPLMYRSIASFAIASSFLMLFVAYGIHSCFGLFHSNTLWVVPYASSLAMKRYIDARLQSSGRMTEFFSIELRGSVLRILFLLLLFFLSTSPSIAVWASITSATLLTQIIWFLGNKEEREIFNYVFCRSSWRQLIEERRSYLPYYLGIALKRLNNNLVTIMASLFFISKESLGIFLLAYRGLLFTIGQLRVFEGLLNHRNTFKKFKVFSVKNKVTMAVLGQITCILLTILLELFSSIKNINYVTIIVLSFSVWFAFFSMIERANAYSKYNIISVNFSIASYTAIYTISVFIFMFLELRNEIVYSIILVFSDAIYFVTIKYHSKSLNLSEKSKLYV